jgi:hypothetical protein
MTGRGIVVSKAHTRTCNPSLGAAPSWLRGRGCQPFLLSFVEKAAHGSAPFVAQPPPLRPLAAPRSVTAIFIPPRMPGSGKTATFLIPILERLKEHSTRVGVRAVVLSPTRELAMQTSKFISAMAKYTTLRFALLVGGDSMELQVRGEGWGACAGHTAHSARLPVTAQTVAVGVAVTLTGLGAVEVTGAVAVSATGTMRASAPFAWILRQCPPCAAVTLAIALSRGDALPRSPALPWSHVA